MPQTEFGTADTFALSIDGDAVDVYVAGVRVTEEDNKPYLVAFATALAASERSLSSRLNFLAHERFFSGSSVEEAFRAIAAGAKNIPSEVFSELRFADWGPITDDYLCFLLPINGIIYLACASASGGAVRAVPITPHQIVATLRCALDVLQPVASPAKHDEA